MNVCHRQVEWLLFQVCVYDWDDCNHSLTSLSLLLLFLLLLLLLLLGFCAFACLRYVRMQQVARSHRLLVRSLSHYSLVQWSKWCVVFMFVNVR